jgi:hypothetical protein
MYQADGLVRKFGPPMVSRARGMFICLGVHKQIRRLALDWILSVTADKRSGILMIVRCILRKEFKYKIFMNWVCTLVETHYVSITETDKLKLLKEKKKLAYSENWREHTTHDKYI